MIDPVLALRSAGSYLRAHPEELLRQARNLARWRVGVPVAALRWVASQLETQQGPRDIVLEAQPPGLRGAATVTEMGTELRVSACVTVERVRFGATELMVEVRLSDVRAEVLGESSSPVAALVRSGALDLSKVANLIAQLPKRPDILVEAVENRLVLDFMRLPRFAADERLRRVVGALASWFSIGSVTTDESHLDVRFEWTGPAPFARRP